MMVDGLTKALSRGPFDQFIDMIELMDQKERLKSIWREEDLREQLKELKTTEQIKEARFAVSRNMGNSPE
jgi:hypothetical protein